MFDPMTWFVASLGLPWLLIMSLMIASYKRKPRYKARTFQLDHARRWAA